MKRSCEFPSLAAAVDSKCKRTSGELSKYKDIEQRNISCLFEILPINQFEGSFPYFRQPTEVGHFSLDSDRQYHDNATKLRHLKIVKDGIGISLDLRNGYKEFVERNEDDPERLDHLLKWITLHLDRFRLPGEQSGAAVSLKDQR